VYSLLMSTNVITGHYCVLVRGVVECCGLYL
jgi:hypothetical protein